MKVILPVQKNVSFESRHVDDGIHELVQCGKEFEEEQDAGSELL